MPNGYGVKIIRSRNSTRVYQGNFKNVKYDGRGFYIVLKNLRVPIGFSKMDK